MNKSIDFILNVSNPVNPSDIERLMPLFVFEISRRINLFATIIIISVGLIGNGLIMIVFSQKRFRTNSNNVFLLTLSILDSFYLILHFFEDTVRSYKDIYLKKAIQVDPIGSFDFVMLQLDIISSSELACRGINYLRYSLRFSSAYIVVAITVYRLSLINTPLSSKLKSKKTAWILVWIVITVSLMLNIWVSLLFKVQIDEETRAYCDVNAIHNKEYFVLAAFYIIIVILAPIIIIISINSLIIYKTNKTEAIRKKLQLYASTRRSKEKESKEKPPARVDRYKSVIDIKIKRFYCNPNQELSSVGKRKNNKTNTTEVASQKLKKLLIMVSITFALFNLPYLIVWLIYFYAITKEALNENFENYLFACLQLAETLTVFNYSFKFFIYCYTGTKFRRQLKHSS